MSADREKQWERVQIKVDSFHEFLFGVLNALF